MKRILLLRFLEKRLLRSRMNGRCHRLAVCEERERERDGEREGAENRRSTAEEVSGHLVEKTLFSSGPGHVRRKSERHFMVILTRMSLLLSDANESVQNGVISEGVNEKNQEEQQDSSAGSSIQGRRRRQRHASQPCRNAKMIHSVASLIRGKSKLLLLESPDTVEIYKLNDPTAHSTRAAQDDVYLPAIATKASSLSSMRGALSQSCPYLYDKRRGSFSSVASGGHPKKQSNLKAQREAKKSNVTVTMTYLGQGQQGSGLDELKVLQQVNGGENICVFRGPLTPGEQFQFVSRRHRGFPFSATLYVNGIMAARISSCCEYRYAPGFQQGRKSCFRLTWLAGGTPCYRCTSLRNKYSSCQQLNNGTKKNLILPLEPSPGNGTIESCPSSPLFVPAKPETKRVRRMRKHVREGGGGGSTDGEDLLAVAGFKETSKKKRKKSQTNRKEGKGRTDGNNRGEEEEGQKRREVDVSPRSTVTEKSSEREEQKQQKTTISVTSLRKEQPRLKKTSTDLVLERCRLQRRLSSCPKAPGSDVELSPESDTILQPDEEPEEEGEGNPGGPSPDKEEPDTEQELQAQLDAMMTVLSTSDEVEQLVLRNTGLTDDLLLSLAGALKSSRSEVTLLNLNLNLVGPYSAHVLLDVLSVKTQVKGLHLFGNKLRDHGVLILLNGIAELQEQTARAAAAVQQAMLLPSEQSVPLQLPTGWSSLRSFALLELDIGGNGLSSEGVKVLASFMRHRSYLRYLGLAQTSAADLAAWKELFDSLKANASLTQIILDENNLGDPGVRLLADMLRENTSLLQVDLDGNGVSDVGGNDIMGALLCRAQRPLRHLSLQENNISEGLMSRIQEEVKRG
ncbi:hypothetical protein F2P81_014281 [Scophthalmus maximus]|uniref:DUF4590 domain-containing protein n=1 Tax=Scophthalmus maximus TaxID=52904 RepID=A0A6A4SNS5_SCOMX|nr:hypothetical protein F2P81_014281 [Scophthalmus maximus]